MNLTWKYSYAASTLKLFEGDHQVGYLKANIWTPYLAQGQLYGKDYIFRSRGFLFRKTQIINAKTNEVVGYVDRGLHPVIKLGEAHASKLNFRNPWMTQWRLVGNKAHHIEFSGGYFSGKFSWKESVPNAIVLASLYARNKVWEMSFFMLIVVAIWLAARMF